MARWVAGDMPQADFCPSKEGGPRCCSAMDYLPRAHEFETDSNSSSSWDLAEVEIDMRRHIQQCSCTCNHMGFGNYMDYPPVSTLFYIYYYANLTMICENSNFL
jgi:hypothetical protein